jgi:hypothetical protein
MVWPQQAYKLNTRDWDLGDTIKLLQRGAPFPVAGDKVRTTKSGLSLKGLQLPNCDQFLILEKVYDKFCAAWGLSRVWRRHRRMIASRFNPANKFLARRLDAMNRLAREAEALSPAERMPHREAYDKIARRLERSRSFQLLALYRVERGWYKTHSAQSVMRTLSGVYRLARRNSKSMRYERWMLNKADQTVRLKWEDYAKQRPEGDWRPLTIPTLEWRVWNHMKYISASIWLEGTHADFQHGARPGRGVGSALKALAERVVKAKNIWEFDLSKFFDRVNWWQLVRTMSHSGLPFELAMWTKNHIEWNPWYQPLDLYREERARKRVRSPVWEAIKYAWRHAGWDVPFSKVMENYWSTFNRLDAWNHNWDLAESLAKEGRVTVHADTESGVPQGDALSPMLACRALQFAIREAGVDESKLLMYMDDGLIFGDGDLRATVKRFEDAMSKLGVEVNWKKSGWVRRDGVLCRDLKFLGHRWLFNQRNFETWTRSGTRGILPVADIDHVVFTTKNTCRPLVAGEKSLSSPEIAARYHLLNFLISWGYMRGRDGPAEANRVLRAEAGSFLALYEDEMRHKLGAYRKVAAVLDLFTASTQATFKLLNDFKYLLRYWKRNRGTHRKRRRVWTGRSCRARRIG